jgi:hypothetical protein
MLILCKGKWYDRVQILENRKVEGTRSEFSNGVEKTFREGEIIPMINSTKLH